MDITFVLVSILSVRELTYNSIDVNLGSLAKFSECTSPHSCALPGLSPCFENILLLTPQGLETA